MRLYYIYHYVVDGVEGGRGETNNDYCIRRSGARSQINRGNMLNEKYTIPHALNEIFRILINIYNYITICIILY